MCHYIEQTPVITQIRDEKSFTRAVAAFVILIFFFVTYSPTALAVMNAKDPQPTKMARENYDTERNFDQLEMILTELNAALTQSSAKKSDIRELRPWSVLTASINEGSFEQERLQLRAVWKQVKKSQQDKLQTANITLSRLAEKIPAKKLTQRQEQLAQAQRHINAMDNYMAGIDQADNAPDLKRHIYAALKHLLDTRAKPAAHVFDSNQMPFGVDSDATRAPYTTAEQLHNYLGLEIDPNFDPAREGVNLVTDLRPTTDVQITDDVRALAVQLNRSPTAIYNWVYNNIHFVPSFGSIQGSDLTLANRQGNAFDIANLLIALLRASNVPARYVYGTVVMGADQMKNWVGGVDDVESARVLLGQGGIPGSAISYGGRYESIRFEHVWVEAYGVFNDEHQLRWNAMDAAFKQYQYTQGVDLLAEVGFDKQGFANLVRNAGQSDASNNWVANVDTTAIQAEMSRYQEALTTYLQNQPADTTLSEIIGGQSIITRGEMEVVGALPYQSYVRTRSFAALPDKLRHYFYVDLAPSMAGGGIGGALGGKPAPFMSYRASLPDLAGKKLSLSFRPASEADEAILQSLLGNLQSEADLPTSIEAGLFDVVAEITVDGEVVANSGSRIIGFGEQLTTNKGFIDPRFGYRETTSPITAGDYQAIGLDLQGVTVKQLQTMQAGIDSLHSKLNEQKYDGLTTSNVVGSLMHAGMIGYFALNDALTNLAAKTNGLVHYRMPSFGAFSTYGQIETVWGNGSQVSLGSMVMDVDWLMANNEGRANCWQDWVAFNQMSGQIASAYEHAIPERLFSTEENSVEAVSTVKALSVASAQGQRIYKITSENSKELLPLINAPSQVKNDIEAALNNGDMAIIHEDPINYMGYSGLGYVLLDPDTGGGAYKILGGGNGAQMALGIAISIFILVMFSPLGLGSLAGAGVLLNFLGVQGFWVFFSSLFGSVITAALSAEMSRNTNLSNYASSMCGVSFGLLLTAALTTFAGPTAGVLTGVLSSYMSEFVGEFFFERRFC